MLCRLLPSPQKYRNNMQWRIVGQGVVELEQRKSTASHIQIHHPQMALNLASVTATSTS